MTCCSVVTVLDRSPGIWLIKLTHGQGIWPKMCPGGRFPKNLSKGCPGVGDGNAWHWLRHETKVAFSFKNSEVCSNLLQLIHLMALIIKDFCGGIVHILQNTGINLKVYLLLCYFMFTNITNVSNSFSTSADIEIIQATQQGVFWTF